MLKPSCSKGHAQLVRIRVRYLVVRRFKKGTAYYWLPTKKLQEAGFLPRRLAEKSGLEIDAIREAEALNAGLDAWYTGQPTAPARRADTLAALDSLFQTDDSFRGIKPRTQRDYLYSIKAALAWAGDMPAGTITRKSVRTWYRALRDERGPAASRNAVAALRRLLSFGVDEGWLAENPALRMGLTTPASRSRVWTVEERDRFVAAAKGSGHPSMAVAVMLGWCLGQRPADLRTLAWTAYDGHAVALRQAKTGQLVYVPALPELRALLDALSRSSTQIVVSEATKAPYQESAFQHLFADIRALAELPADLQFRDLRRTLATALGAAGCTDDQIRAVTGHKTRSVVAVYVRPDHTYAEGAIRRLARNRRRSHPGKS